MATEAEKAPTENAAEEVTATQSPEEEVSTIGYVVGGVGGVVGGVASVITAPVYWLFGSSDSSEPQSEAEPVVVSEDAAATPAVPDVEEKTIAEPVVVSEDTSVTPAVEVTSSNPVAVESPAVEVSAPATST